jgi:hypothetical protein
VEAEAGARGGDARGLRLECGRGLASHPPSFPSHHSYFTCVDCARARLTMSLVSPQTLTVLVTGALMRKLNDGFPFAERVRV